jgi:exonuclease SbcD
MKIAHLADLHCCRENADSALASLRFFTEHIKKSPVDMVCIAGDTWDASVLNTEASGFNRFVEAIRDIADLAPIAMIYGAPTHDTDGPLEIFRKVTCKYGISILEPGQAYFLDEPEGRSSITLLEPARPAALLFGIPEPRKKYLLADTSMGKDDTEETIRDAMHKMCFLLAAKRKEYDSIPCIVLYHGDVAGSTLQNDQTVERGTGIAITVDDLNDIGADYYALGHIHKPQKVGNLPAYYAGSIYPKNFGETHKAGFNIVDMPQAGSYGFNADLERINFPHPQNMKIEMALTDNFQKGGYKVPAFYEKDEVKDKKVWLEITCNKEQRAFLDVEAELKNLLVHDAVIGSRLTVRDIPVETVRAAEITEVNTPTKKFEVWAQNSNLEYEPAMLDKIKVLETEILKSSVRAAGEWELVSLKLRGAIGIKKGFQKDEVCLNFNDFGSGLIALVGSNGRGKTTYFSFWVLVFL